MKHCYVIRWAAAIGCVCSAGFVSHTSAISLTFDQVTCLGHLDRVGGGKDREENYINQLAGMTPNTTSTVDGRTYTRSGHGFDSLPAADFEFRENHDHTGIVLDGSYDYLLARYGSSATVVWYVGGLVGSYDLPGSYNGKDQIAHYSLFQSERGVNPSTAVSISDGGSTLGLLGLGVVSLGFLHGRVKRRCGSLPESNKVDVPL